MSQPAPMVLSMRFLFYSVYWCLVSGIFTSCSGVISTCPTLMCSTCVSLSSPCLCTHTPSIPVHLSPLCVQLYLLVFASSINDPAFLVSFDCGLIPFWILLPARFLTSLFQPWTVLNNIEFSSPVWSIAFVSFPLDPVPWQWRYLDFCQRVRGPNHMKYDEVTAGSQL